MCGRLNVTDDPLARLVSEMVGIPFSPQLNLDLKPSENVSTIACQHGQYQQCELSWGIKPHWAKRLIINAQAESVADKPTFRRGFESQRVIVPCSGWYEWRQDSGHKRKYLFSEAENRPLYMAGIIVDTCHLVTLTTQPNAQCAQYHHRMPLLVPDFALEQWLCSSAQDAQKCLTFSWKMRLSIKLSA